MTTNINLLPWREERRERNKMLFLSGLGGSGILACLIVVITFIVLGSLIDSQTHRNSLIEAEIARYNKQIIQIKALKSARDALISRMTVIQELQESRPEIVHFFDELVNIIPRPIYLLKVERIDRNIMLTGHTDSNSTVSSLMQSVRHNYWLNSPKLEEVEEVTNKKHDKLYNQFRLKLILKPKNQVLEGALDE